METMQFSQVSLPWSTAFQPGTHRGRVGPLVVVFLALPAVLPAPGMQMLALILLEAEAGHEGDLGQVLPLPWLVFCQRGAATELCQADLGPGPRREACLTSSTCRNSRKSRIRSDSSVICSKAESHTKRSRTLIGESTADQPSPTWPIRTRPPAQEGREMELGLC